MFRPTVEPLPARLLPATLVLALDFTPDRIAGEQRVARFDGSPRDAQVVLHSVRRDLAPYGVRVVAGDLVRDTNLGQRVLGWGRLRSDVTVAVMYVGGVRHDRDVTVLGEAYQAPVGSNVEHYAYAYAGAASAWWPRHSAGWRRAVAGTVVHEWCHLMGVGHACSGSSRNVMGMWWLERGDRPLIENRRVRAEVVGRDEVTRIGWQNAAAELRTSRGQPSYPGTEGLRYL